MAIRYEAQYRVKRLDNLGDPEFWNRRWQDIDRRLHARELDATKIDDAVDRLEAVALARLNDQLSPIVGQAITRLREFGLLFSATSHTERTIQIGTIQFVIDEAMRESFVATGFLIIRPTVNLSIGMSVRTLSYVPSTGVLTVDSYSMLGAGSFSDWTIGVTGDPDLAHATRTDNPHQTTAEQVGASTMAQVDDAVGAAAAVEMAARNAAISAAIASVIAGAPPALNTLNKLAAAIANNPSFATAITAELANRLRIDEGQVLSQAQKDQAMKNLGSFTTGDAKLTLKTVADGGWVMMQDGTIGDPLSGASARAHADCWPLFQLLFNNIPDYAAPLFDTGGNYHARSEYGNSAANAFNGYHARIQLTRQLGRSLTVAGQGSGLSYHDLGGYDGAETHTQTTSELAWHWHNGTDNAPGLMGSYGSQWGITDGGTAIWVGNHSTTTQGAGSQQPFSIIPPRAFWNIMIKL
jgi:hypothetical protein